MLLPLLQNNLLTGAVSGVTGNLAITEAGDTASGLAGVRVNGTGSLGELGDTLTSSGTIAFASVLATLGVTESADTASGVAAITGGVPENGPSGGATWLNGYRPKHDYTKHRRRSKRDELLFIRA